MFRRRKAQQSGIAASGGELGENPLGMALQVLGSLDADGVVGVERAFYERLDLSLPSTFPMQARIATVMAQFVEAVVVGAARPAAELDAGLGDYRRQLAGGARAFVRQPAELMVRFASILEDHLSRPMPHDERHRSVWTFMMYATACGPSAQRPELQRSIREAYGRAAIAVGHGVDMRIDVGCEVVDEVFGLLQVDDEWSVRKDRSFDWWAWRLKQQVRAAEPWIDDDLAIYRVSADTDIVADAVDSVALRAAIAECNKIPMGGCVYFDAERGVVASHVSRSVHVESMWVTKILAVAVQEQIDIAELRADWLAEVAAGRVATSAHPETGQRGEPDSILTRRMWDIGRDSYHAMWPGFDDFDAVMDGVEAALRQTPIGRKSRREGSALLFDPAAGLPAGRLCIEEFDSWSTPHGAGPDEHLGGASALVMTLDVDASAAINGANDWNLQTANPVSPDRLGAWSESESGLRYRVVVPVAPILGESQTAGDAVTIVMNLVLSMFTVWRQVGSRDDL